MFDLYNENLRILNFTHIDFDGVVSAIVIKNFYKQVTTVQINYGKEPDILTQIGKYRGQYDAIIFTDFTPATLGQGNTKNAIAEIRAVSGVPVLILDHHESAIKYNDPSGIAVPGTSTNINVKYCGAMLAWKYFSVKKDLSHIKDLVYLANDYDLFTLNDPRAMPFNALYWQMGFNWFLTRFGKGNTALYPEEKQYLLEYRIAVQNTYDNLPVSDLPHNGCFYECEKYMAEMSYRLANDGYKYQIIKHGHALSIRSATDDINLVDVCQYLGTGGGHRKAVGIPLRVSDDLMQLVQRICYAVEHNINNHTELPF